MASSVRRGEFAEFFDDLVLQGDDEHGFAAYDGDFFEVVPCIEIDVGPTVFEDVVFAGQQFECRIDRAVGDAGWKRGRCRNLGERGIAFCSFTEGFDTTTAGGEFLFHIMAALAQMGAA